MCAYNTMMKIFEDERGESNIECDFLIMSKVVSHWNDDGNIERFRDGEREIERATVNMLEWVCTYCMRYSSECCNKIA